MKLGVNQVTELTPEAAAELLRTPGLNLIRRGADGSLVLSADKWTLDERGASLFRFRSETVDGMETIWLDVDLQEVEHLAWDRLPKQERRSQVRLYFHPGDVWTFSGYLALEPPTTS
jgi:hypothetical protein